MKKNCGYPILRDPDNVVRNNCPKLRCGFKLPGLPVYVFVARNAALDPRLFPPECFPWDFLQNSNPGNANDGDVIIEDATGLPLLLEC
jgi:hypothetical protein